MANNVLVNYAPLLGSADYVEGIGAATDVNLTGAWVQAASATINSDGVWDIGASISVDAAGAATIHYEVRKNSTSLTGVIGMFVSSGTTIAIDLGRSANNVLLSQGDTVSVWVRENLGTTRLIGASGARPMIWARKVAQFVPNTAQISGVVRSNSGYTDTVIGSDVMRTVWGVGAGVPAGTITVTFEQPFAGVPHLEFNDGLDSSSYREYKILTKTATGFTAECRFSGGAVTTGSLAWRATGLKP